MPAANFAIGRDGNDVSLIVDHWMAVSFDSALRRFRNPTQEVSAHFLIGTDGRIAQVVPTDDTAYHAGDLTTNLRSIGIEHEAGPDLPPSDALYAASAWLHREMARIYHLTLEVGVTVQPHRAIVPTQCPGTLDLDRIVALANEEADVTPEEARQIAEKAIADAGLDPNTINTIKRALNEHVHLPGSITPAALSLPLIPPVDGATYAGRSADGSQVFWLYPDGVVR